MLASSTARSSGASLFTVAMGSVSATVANSLRFASSSSGHRLVFCHPGLHAFSKNKNVLGFSALYCSKTPGFARFKSSPENDPCITQAGCNMSPADIIPMPPIIEMAIAPVRGTGRKLPPTSLAKRTSCQRRTRSTLTVRRQRSNSRSQVQPTQAKIAHTSRMPTGDNPIFFSIKSAKNRNANIVSDVKTNSHLPCSDVKMLPVIF